MAYIEDVLVGIGNFFNEKEFLHDREKWGWFFYERTNKYSLLKNIPFRKGLFPESDYIDQAYHNLIASGLIQWRGIQTHPPHKFSEKCKEGFEKYVKPLLNENEFMEMELLSKEFQQEFSYSL